ncbi:MAG: DinB family protein [Streptosporangiaceae bacterium]
MRTEAPLIGDERSMLVAWLEFHRETLAVKCEGLTADQLRARAVPPSSLSLLGLVRHMADVERNWFRNVLDGQALAFRYSADDNLDGEFDDVHTADPDEAFAGWRVECAIARDLLARAVSLEVTGSRIREGREQVYSLRWILIHMIEEYARHNGHADLLREAIDGVTGE